MTNLLCSFGWTSCLVLCLPLAAFSADAPGVAPAAGSPRAFQGQSVDGQDVAVAPQAARQCTVVCFLGTQCPLARLYGPRLAEMAQKYGPRGVRFIGVNSNQQDSPEEILAYARELRLTFPLLKDEGNVLADRYQASRTPEVFLLDSQLNVRYQGRIDDQYEPGVNRTAASRQDLREALDDLLADRLVQVPHTQAVGCLIGRRDLPRPTAVSTRLTFSREISRILQKHCVECHRPQEIGPFSVTDYREVIGWGPTMVESIEEGRMPPWSADPQVGRFANARQMPAADKRALREWVEAGMPEGDPADLPPTPEIVRGWQLPHPPELVLPMHSRPFRVPADGTIEYQYFVVDPQFTSDKWVTGAQVIPGSREAVHHAIVFVRPPDGTPFRGIGWLTAYVPGQRLGVLPPGYARRVPAGSKLVFQMHYTSNGTPHEDISQVGLNFADAGSVTHEVSTLIGLNQEFEIPPHAARHEVKGEVRGLTPEGTLLAITPHMHYRGQAFRVQAARGERLETLLHVPNYSFNWQHSYELQEPLPLTDVRRIEFSAYFNNSPSNPFNPDPAQWVTWGDQSWEEMAIVFLEVAEPVHSTTPAAAAAEPGEGDEERTPRERQARAEQFVREFFLSLDTDRDGVVRQSEVPLAVQRFSFHRFDANRDGQVTQEEVRRVADRLP